MTQNKKSYSSASIKKLKNSTIEISGSVAAEEWQKYRAEALRHINESVSLDGFRKGMVPENILIAKVGEMAILEEMAEHALSKAYVDIIIDNKIDAIGKPNIQVTKLAKENPLEFKIETAVIPSIELPDYKKISRDIVTKQKNVDVKLTEEEFGNKLNDILKSHAVTELSDDFVKKLGPFSNVEDFKNKFRDMLSQQKVDGAKEKLRIEIAEKIVDETIIDLPPILVESETNRIGAQFKDDIERMGVKLEDYLKHAKKTLDEIRGEWKPHAEKKAKIQLVLNAIANKENIIPTAQEIDREVKHILEHYKDAEPERVATYAETVITNEKVFEFLSKSDFLQ